MKNKYFGQCHYCGAPVNARSGMVELIGKDWKVAHLGCWETKRPDVLLSQNQDKERGGIEA